MGPILSILTAFRNNGNKSAYFTCKYISVLALFLLCGFTGFSQDLYVDNDSYLYARDVVVFVNNDIRLETPTSNIFMRGDAQLVQNTDIKNSDLGELSIYQNQTTGVYEYNFWCSPVGVSDTSFNANVDFNGSNIHDPADHTDLTNVVSVPYGFIGNSYNGTTNQLATYWMFTLISAGGYNGWTQILNTGNAAAGYGFTLKGSPNPNNVLDFRGRPNNGDISIECLFTGVDADPSSGPTHQVETLTGNPYPSALDLKLFLTDGFGSTAPTGTNNRNILNGEAFFWEQKPVGSHNLADYEGGYSVYTPGDPTNLADNGSYAIAPFVNYNFNGSVNGTTTGNTQNFAANNARRYAAIGQGFIVSSLDNGGAPGGGIAVFNNAMRLYLAEDSTTGGNGSVFAKNSAKAKSEENEKSEVIAMSHNGVNYQEIINNPITIPEIRIHTKIDNTFYRESVIAFREGTPNNNTYNRFFDGRNYEGGLTRDAYLLSDDKELVIKSINYSEDTKIPLGLKTNKNNTPFEISIFSLEAVPENVSIYIHDKLNNSYTNVINNTFTIVLNEGTYNDRFEITFRKQNVLHTETISIRDFIVFENKTQSQLEILNPKRLNINKVMLYDVSGKEILNKTINTSKDKTVISTKHLSAGMYVVSIKITDNQTLNKKVIISGN
jgi:hypothetical protein